MILTPMYVYTKARGGFGKEHTVTNKAALFPDYKCVVHDLEFRISLVLRVWEGLVFNPKVLHITVCI